MGVAGLWDILKPAAKTRSLTDIAIKEGFETNPDGKRGYRLGIDASIWFFHAEYGREGENPVLRTLFFRCATLMHTTFLPLFVFDGPKRPDVKRGKKINRTGHKLIPGMKQIVEAFGFEWRMAPGEAEAELAYLNRIGVIDGILSDDVDNFLFGAITVIRNSSNTLSGNRSNPVLNSAGKDDKNHTRVFRLEDITANPEVRLTRGGMILIGLMSGGDYHQAGLTRCGPTTAHGLAKCGFGDSLYDAAHNLDRNELSEFLVSWRNEIRQELRTNSRKEIGRKQVALANSIPEDFPDIDILLSYVNPITSETMGRENNNAKVTWSKEPDLAKLAATCEFYFEWGYKEAIIKRFRTILWHSIVLRILRRAVLDNDAKFQRHHIPTTPSKKGKAKDIGTPSKMIAAHFSSLALATPTKVYISGSESEDDEEGDRLIIKIHSTRTHTSTDGLLEYRLEIRPKQLVRLTESGIKGTRVPDGPDEWASEGEDDEESGTKKRGPVDPETHLRLWMPACMVKIVEPGLVRDFEELQEKKNQKKSKKGTRSTDLATEKPTRKTKKATKTVIEDDVFSSLENKVASQSRKAGKGKGKAVLLSDDDDEYNLFEPNSPQIEKKKEIIQGTALPNTSVIQKPVLPRTGVRDLTKKGKLAAGTGLHDNTVKSFFPVAKASTSIASKSKAQLASISESSKGRSGLKEPLEVIGKPQHRVPTISQSSSGHVLPSLTSKTLDSLEEENSFWEEYNPIMWTKKAANVEKSLSPKLKRKQHGKSSASGSESDAVERLKKSPRKKVDQTSPPRSRRPVSPSPTKSRRAMPLQKKIDEVIEITSSSDSEPEDPLPARSKPLPPLLAARGKVALLAKGNSQSSNLDTSNARRTQKTSILDIIDLT